MGGWHNQPTDMRKVRRRAERNLIFGMVLVFLVGGGVLIGSDLRMVVADHGVDLFGPRRCDGHRDMAYPQAFRLSDWAR